MLKFLRQLFNRPTAPVVSAPQVPAPAASAQAQFELLNKLAPLKEPVAPGAATPQASSTPETAATSGAALPTRLSFVCREPVLNRNEQIAGYAFTLHEKLQLRLQGEKDLLQKVYDDALLRNLTSLGINSLLGHRLAFVRLSPTSLGNPLIQRLPSQNTVLMLAPARQILDPDTLQPQLDALRQQGFSYGWRLGKQTLADHPSLLGLARQGDYVQIQTPEFDGLEIKQLLKNLTTERPATLPKMQLIAHELDTFDEFHLCFKTGFDFFQGHFVISREDWHPPKSDINRLLVMKLLNLLRSDEEATAIAQQVTADPVMTFKLLRFINSPVRGLQSPVTTLDKALLVLGREGFYRWLSLLLFDIKAPGFRERMLTEQALTRAFFLESLAGHGPLPAQKDQLFILGLFSMLDLLIGQPIESLLQQTRLPDAISGALLGQPGPFGNALQLAIAVEDQKSETIDQQAALLELDAVDISRRALEALSAAHEIMSISEG
jgi:EAL and modified HD-GYP domain-containing signal transduction protein